MKQRLPLSGVLGDRKAEFLAQGPQPERHPDSSTFSVNQEAEDISHDLDAQHGCDSVPDPR